MNFLFLTMFASLLLVTGPVVGFRSARAVVPLSRWRILMGSAAGGLAAGVVYRAALILTELASFPTTSVLVRGYLLYFAKCAGFGLVLGLAGLVPRPASTFRLVLTALGMVAALEVVQMVKNPAFRVVVFENAQTLLGAAMLAFGVYAWYPRRERHSPDTELERDLIFSGAPSPIAGNDTALAWNETAAGVAAVNLTIFQELVVERLHMAGYHHAATRAKDAWSHGEPCTLLHPIDTDDAEVKTDYDPVNARQAIVDDAAMTVSYGNDPRSIKDREH